MESYNIYLYEMPKGSASITIKNWSVNDRPREKLLRFGPANLSDSELLAIIIGSGNKDETAVDLSKRMLLCTNNSLNAFGKLTIPNLMKFNGIGEAKAITITAAMELGRRRHGEAPASLKKIDSSKSVFQIMHPIISELQHEEFWILYLNNSNRIIERFKLSQGGITGTLVDIRLVLKKALELTSISMILVHNHPSGSLQPSESDKQLTTKLKLAAENLDLKVLDHLIITENHYFSFADQGLL